MVWMLQVGRGWNTGSSNALSYYLTELLEKFKKVVLVKIIAYAVSIL